MLKGIGMAGWGVKCNVGPFKAIFEDIGILSIQPIEIVVFLGISRKLRRDPRLLPRTVPFAMYGCSFTSCPP